PVDWPGAGLLAGGLAMFLLGVTKGPEWAWSETAFALIGAGIVILLLFVVRELTARYPLVDLSLFKVREFAAGQTAGLFAMMSLASMMFLFPFYWQGIRGYEAQEAGLLMLPIPMTLMVLAPISGRLSDRWGSRGIATVGLLTIITGLFLLSQLTPDMPVWQVLVRLMVFGAGIGMFIAPNNNGVMSAVPGHKRGVAAGLLGMFRFTGQSVGVALGGTVFALFATAGAGSAFNLESLPSPEMMTLMADDPEMLAAFRSAFVDGLTGVALAAIPFAAVAAWLSFLRGSKPGSGPDESPAEEARDRAVAEAD
ncbi:MAG: MFS transporter, partial [Chloroflexota bacterium]